jgi:RNA polymerase-interacting CarD/CdnL/TRCF family regulator
MNNEKGVYQTGDQVVHQVYGVGRIEGIETRQISGEEAPYYHLIIKATSSHVWIPTDKLAEDARPLTNPEKFREALNILERPPREMAANIKTRTQRIAEVRAQNSPASLARLLRDLWGRQKKRGTLSQSETDAMRRITNRFLGEWAACMGLTLEVVERRLEQQLRRGRQQATTAD